MHWSKEILIFLLFLTFSGIVWFVHASDRHRQHGPADDGTAEQEMANQDAVTEKKVLFAVEVMDVPEDRILRVFPSSVSVYLRVHVSDFESAGTEGVRVWCTYPTRNTDALILHTDVTDPRILGVRTEPDKVEYLVEYP